jgi:release factor glutamine methyltransferase
MAERPLLESRTTFGPLDVCFDETVLRPRRWTLSQSCWAAELALGVGAGRILELFSGVGHIGLAASVFSGRGLVQVDVSASACRFAGLNAARAGVPVDIRHSDLARALRGDESFPVIIADPPYLPLSDVGRFPEDPVLAVNGGLDGLDLSRACVALAGRHLAGGGIVVLQLGSTMQVAALEGEIRAAKLCVAETRVLRHDRVLTCLRQPQL